LVGYLFRASETPAHDGTTPFFSSFFFFLSCPSCFFLFVCVPARNFSFGVSAGFDIHFAGLWNVIEICLVFGTTKLDKVSFAVFV